MILISVLTLMLLTTSLKSIIPKPSLCTGVNIVVLLMRSGAFLPSILEFQMNLYISSFSFFSIFNGIRVVVAMKRICDKPKVLKIIIFPMIDRYIFFHNLNWA